MGCATFFETIILKLLIIRINHLAQMASYRISTLRENVAHDVIYMKTKTLFELLREQSCETWERIGFARTRKGLRIFETTITQNIIFNIHQQNPSQFVIYEATDEKTNGNDIELFIETEKGFLFLAIQSKIIYKTNDYRKMDHGNQHCNLMDYAFSRGGIPFYLLYNYSNKFTIVDKSVCGIPCVEKDFGCTLITADFIRENYYAKQKMNKKGELKWKVPCFSDLHPAPAIPWFILANCFSNNINYYSLLEILLSDIQSINFPQLKIYKLKDIMDNNDWLHFTSISDKKESYGTAEEYQGSEIYSPKFRFVLRNQQ
jgi:hypothetical protein